MWRRFKDLFFNSAETNGRVDIVQVFEHLAVLLECSAIKARTSVERNNLKSCMEITGV